MDLSLLLLQPLQETFLVFISEEDLLKELAEAREARRAAERYREDLVKQAKQMQNKTQNRRNHGMLLLSKMYYFETLTKICIHFKRKVLGSRIFCNKFHKLEWF